MMDLPFKMTELPSKQNHICKSEHNSHDPLWHELEFC